MAKIFRSPILGLLLRPKLGVFLKQSRNIRPNIKIAREKFQLQLNVRNFALDEIRVKARSEYVIIEGKQQKQTKTGLVMRQFVRKFKLPTGTILENMESKLSQRGILTISAPRKIVDENFPSEILIPIKAELASGDTDAAFVPVQDNASKPAEANKDACEQKKGAAVKENKSSSADSKPKVF